MLLLISLFVQMYLCFDIVGMLNSRLIISILTGDYRKVFQDLIQRVYNNTEIYIKGLENYL